jgi:hypothetical protein
VDRGSAEAAPFGQFVVGAVALAGEDQRREFVLLQDLSPTMRRRFSVDISRLQEFV